MRKDLMKMKLPSSRTSSNMTKIIIIQGDITTEQVDVVVNAANNSLRGGGGVDGAIHKAAGPELFKECCTLLGCETGQAKITKGYNLPAKHIIHTVGPIYYGNEGGEALLLQSCYLNTLNLAKEHGIKTIAFPAISTGVYAYPLVDATSIAISTVVEFVKQEPNAFEEIRFVTFSDEAFNIYRDIHEKYK